MNFALKYFLRWLSDSTTEVALTRRDCSTSEVVPNFSVSKRPLSRRRLSLARALANGSRRRPKGRLLTGWVSRNCVQSAVFFLLLDVLMVPYTNTEFLSVHTWIGPRGNGVIVDLLGDIFSVVVEHMDGWMHASENSCKFVWLIWECFFYPMSLFTCISYSQRQQFYVDFCFLQYDECIKLFTVLSQRKFIFLRLRHECLDGET